VTASLYTAAVLGIADLLGEGPRSAQDLAGATRILRTVRAAISRAGRLIIFDRVLPERITADDPVSQSGTLMDLNMLVNVTGRERTETQFRQLLAVGGFTLSSARSLPSGLGIVEGLPA
jgi:hypothetical protein